MHNNQCQQSENFRRFMNLVPDIFLITLINCEIIATSSYLYNLTLLSLFQNGVVYISVKYQKRDYLCLNTLFDIHTLKQSKGLLVTFSFRYILIKGQSLPTTTFPS